VWRGRLAGWKTHAGHGRRVVQPKHNVDGLYFEQATANRFCLALSWLFRLDTEKRHLPPDST